MGTNRRKRDPLYENTTGRPANPEAIKLRRWIHQCYAGKLLDLNGDPLTGERKSGDTESLPGRFRYYEAIMAGAIDKKLVQTVESIAAGVTITKGDVLWKAALMWVRENGLVPDVWVDDRTRHLYDFTGYRSIREGLRAYLPVIKLDPWDGRPPLLVVESESSAAALEVVARDLRIRMAPLRGQAGRAYLANKVAPHCYDGQIVRAVVDLDKVGDDISNSAQERLERFATKRQPRATSGPLSRRPQRTVTFDWRVIALTDEQVDEHGIVRVPRVDGREKDGPTRMVAETEALGADRLRSIVRAELEALLPEPLVSIRGREREQREELEPLLADEEDDEWADDDDPAD